MRIAGLVSTVIPVHNRPQMLEQAVLSVLNQNYRPIEVIIVNDGSTDETGRVVEMLALTNPDMVRAIHTGNEGVGQAREAGRKMARGEFLQYLDSDDLLLSGKFELQVTGLIASPSCGISYGWTRFRHSDGRLEPEPWKYSGRQVDTMFPSFLLSRWWDTPTPLYRALVCDQVGPWSDLRLEEDWEYDCRVAALRTRLHYTPSYVAEVRDHDDNRLCRGNALDPFRLQQRARSHEMILKHALRSGISESSMEMQHYARELFLLCRQCGAAGLVAESQKLFELSRLASGKSRAHRWDFRAYEMLARAAGWLVVGRVACYSDRFRSKKQSHGYFS